MPMMSPETHPELAEFLETIEQTIRLHKRWTEQQQIPSLKKRRPTMAQVIEVTEKVALLYEQLAPAYTASLHEYRKEVEEALQGIDYLLKEWAARPDDIATFRQYCADMKAAAETSPRRPKR